jgi:hypothetical protein
MSKLSDILARSAEGAYGEDSDAIGKLAGLLFAEKFDQSWGPFICGTMGKQGPDGLHDGYLICPTYGADVQCTAHFKRVQ